MFCSLIGKYSLLFYKLSKGEAHNSGFWFREPYNLCQHQLDNHSKSSSCLLILCLQLHHNESEDLHRKVTQKDGTL